MIINYKHFFFGFIIFAFILRGAQAQPCSSTIHNDSLLWTSVTGTNAITSPAFCSCSNTPYQYTITTSVQGMKNISALYGNGIIIPEPLNAANLNITLTITFNQAVDYLKVRLFDLDEVGNGMFPIPVERVTNITPAFSNFAMLIGNWFPQSGNTIISPDDSNPGIANDNTEGWLEWNQPLTQVSFTYVRPGTNAGLVIKELEFACNSPCGSALNPNPTVIAGASSSTICRGDMVTLTATGNATTYTWNSIISGNITTVMPSDTTTYVVVGGNANGCLNSDTVIVFVNDCDTIVGAPTPTDTNICVVTIPNVFTPNFDKVNDALIFNFCEKIISTKIYNRWGTIVFSTAHPNYYWDGHNTSGVECVDGTYFYVIQTEKETYKGFIQLIR